MSKLLTVFERDNLIKLHRIERDGRIKDRIKSVLLRDQGWNWAKIATALFLDEETVRRYVRTFKQEGRLHPENGGSSSNLTQDQTSELISHIESKSYTKVLEICSYVSNTYKVDYSVSGMNDWLKRNGFSYKKPKGIPAKADVVQQELFIESYNQLMNETLEDEPILFGDCVHPTQATRITYGWIRTGKDKLIATSASRTRLNIAGAINLEDMNVISQQFETINSASMIEFFKKVQEAYPSAHKIHLILDQAGYNRSAEVKEFMATEGCRIQIHLLPSYSPNLNPIERLWKVMHEHVSNNHYFSSAKEFRQKIDNFFENTLPNIAWSLRDKINDNFQTIDAGKLQLRS